ncbi:MAG: hypothetical protein JSS49_10670 [Planctomycetes bacterium]|nr:hypothetical protein [Planctomycetota bacterium]
MRRNPGWLLPLIGTFAIALVGETRSVEARPRYQKVWTNMYLKEGANYSCVVCHRREGTTKYNEYNDYGMAVKEALGEKNVVDEDAIRAALKKAEDKLPRKIADEETPAFSIRSEEFESLSSADQRLMVKNALENRLNKALNVDFNAVQLGHTRDGTSDVEDMANYLISDVVRNIDAAVIECHSDLGQVHVEIPWNPPWGEPEHLGTRKMVLDPLKGFLPIEGTASWKKPRRDGKVSWRTEEFKVEESKMVQGVWFPSNLKEWIRASSTSESIATGQVTVWETKVSKLSTGIVVTDDLVVQLPAGTRVADALNGVVYTVCENGARLNEQTLIGPDGLTVPGTKGIRRSRFWLFVLNGGVLMLTGVVLLLVARRRRA